MINNNKKRPFRSIVMAWLTFLWLASCLGQIWLISLGVVEGQWPAVVMFFVGAMCWVASFEVPTE